MPTLTELMIKIYRLVDPKTQEVRYVGLTTQRLGHRYNVHICAARKGSNKHVHNWIRQLLAEDLKPIVELIEETMDAEREAYWIMHYLDKGCNLTNQATGGEVNSGYKLSEETKRRISIANSNPSEQTRKRMSESAKKRIHSEETKEKMRQVHLGKPHPHGGRFSASKTEAQKELLNLILREDT